MAGAVFRTWWSRVGPYYSKAYQEVWVGLGIMTYFYYKLSYGGKKAVKSKSDHSH
ncbi:ATP synthase subunit ATP5MPL, mitochondrial [Ictalurus furcatus]|uniref:ATP synthase subunit ATP5MPL, mitochondrial n=1 Tax=Ictalurus furcatus TaxID=66913 RepID=UPI00234FE0E9|nr:ATP synthase subunit ATP5MPL, mitochondrial [Ictalurus furcatus]